MDSEEKLIALKKAYADIILNTSKEAAARVMSSERRAVQYQHELKVAKEEALRMLLRLKQMMDFRNIEAEAAALNQQKKIEELEAQLQEAEDIVEDLREKLGEMQAEMERIKKDNSQPNDASSRETATRVQPYKSSNFLHPNSLDEVAIAYDVPTSQQSECSKCCNSKKACVCGTYIRNRDLPSIISRNIEPALYRNGCTQRIRACERDPLDKESCLSQETDELKHKNNGKEIEVDEDASKAPSSGPKTLIEAESKLSAGNKLSSFPPFHRKRKRATRRRKTDTASSRKCTVLEKSDQFLEPATKHIPLSVKENTHSSENFNKISSIFSDKAETWTHLGCAESSDGRVLQKDEGLKEKMETVITEDSQPPVCNMDVEKFDTPSNSIELKSCDNGLPNEPVRERIIKYTFQRRNKRGALSGSEVNVPTECDVEKRKADKKNNHRCLEPSNSSLLVESSRDSRRLAQVARQLISLSEKKWWH